MSFETFGLSSPYPTVDSLSAPTPALTRYSLTEFAHWHYLLSATLAFLVAAMYNYTLNRNWTFKTNGSQKKQLPAFLLTGGTALLLNNLILFVSVDTFGLWYIYGKIIATAVVTFWNFFINKYFTFRLK